MIQGVLNIGFVGERVTNRNIYDIYVCVCVFPDLQNSFFFFLGGGSTRRFVYSLLLSCLQQKFQKIGLLTSIQRKGTLDLIVAFAMVE